MLHVISVTDIPSLRLSTTKSLFPVQRVAVIMASRAAASFFFPFFLLVGNIFWEKKFCKNEKKSPQSALFLDTQPLHRKQNFFLDWPNVRINTWYCQSNARFSMFECMIHFNSCIYTGKLQFGTWPVFVVNQVI